MKHIHVFETTDINGWYWWPVCITSEDNPPIYHWGYWDIGISNNDGTFG